MGVKDLCLGVLTFGNANGYDIKKFFPQNFGHFYAAGHGSIYPELTELTAARTLDYPAVKSARRNRLSRTGLQSY